MLRFLKKKIDFFRETRKLSFKNVEGVSEYDFTLTRGKKRPGMSAMLRAKNEKKYICNCIGSIIEIFDEVVFIDNGSDDGTLDAVTELTHKAIFADKLKIYSYPFRIARCGDEHWATDESSLHSLVYYYNWCLSKCATEYVVKWDADMIVRKSAASAFKKELRKVYDDADSLWLIPIQTIYRARDGSFWAQEGEVYREPRISPNRPSVRYHKSRYWEKLRSDIPLRKASLEQVSVFELKDVEKNEFSHWDTQDFPTDRKRLEYENFLKVRSGDVEGDFAEVPQSDVLYL